MVDNIENLTIEELKIKINELKLRREEIKNEILLRKERNSMNTLTAALCTLYVSVSSLLCNYQTALVSLFITFDLYSSFPAKYNDNAVKNCISSG